MTGEIQREIIKFLVNDRGETMLDYSKDKDNITSHRYFITVCNQWLAGIDYVVTKSGNLYRLHTNQMLTNYDYKTGVPTVVNYDDADIEDQEMIIEELIGNRQPYTLAGQEAIERGLEMEERLTKAKQAGENFVKEYFQLEE